MISFKTDVELEVVTDFDEKADQITGQSNETFKAGQELDVQIVDEYSIKGDTYCDLQFGDGSVAFGIRRDSFTVL